MECFALDYRKEGDRAHFFLQAQEWSSPMSTMRALNIVSRKSLGLSVSQSDTLPVVPLCLALLHGESHGHTLPISDFF